MIPYSCQYIDDLDIKSVLLALKKDNITQGELVNIFEREIANYVGAKFAIVFNSATSALNIAYKILKLQYSECITTPITFCATSNMMLENDILPVFCDINMNGNINENIIENLITQKTKAIVSVDYAGNSVEVDKISSICKKHNLYFISDSSHSFGGEFNNKKVGSFADITIFSFHALKPITTIEGGAIVTNNEHLYKQALLLRSHCVIKNNLWDSELSSVGYNFRLSDIACALGLSQLSKINDFISKREKIAIFYNNFFSNNKYFTTINIPNYIRSTYHLYPILFRDISLDIKKKIFISLHNSGIGVQVHYKPLYRFNLYKNYNNKSLQNADKFYEAELSIPCNQKMSMDNAEKVAYEIIRLCKKYL